MTRQFKPRSRGLWCGNRFETLADQRRFRRRAAPTCPKIGPLLGMLGMVVSVSQPVKAAEPLTLLPGGLIPLDGPGPMGVQSNGHDRL